MKTTNIPEAYLPVADERVLSLYLSAVGPDSEGEWPGRCPLHDDHNDSASFNFLKGVWHCFAGCLSGSIGELVWQVEKDRQSQGASVRVTVTGESLLNKGLRKPASLPTKPQVKEWVRNFHENVDGCRDRLIELKWPHAAEQTCAMFIGNRVGYDGDKRAYVLPILNERGRLVNVKWYRPDPAPGSLKTWGVRGHNEPRLYPHWIYEQSEDFWRGSTLFLMEGEMDTIYASLLLRNKRFLTGTGGAMTFPDDWTAHFRDRPVVLCFDSDETGRKARRKVAEKLSRVTAVAHLEFPEGMDFTDYANSVSRDVLREDFGAAAERAGQEYALWKEVRA